MCIWKRWETRARDGCQFCFPWLLLPKCQLNVSLSFCENPNLITHLPAPTCVSWKFCYCFRTGQRKPHVAMTAILAGRENKKKLRKINKKHAHWSKINSKLNFNSNPIESNRIEWNRIASNRIESNRTNSHVWWVSLSLWRKEIIVNETKLPVPPLPQTPPNHLAR